MNEILDSAGLEPLVARFHRVVEACPIRPRHMIPDFSLLGYAKDLLDHAYATALLARSERPRASFASARAAKEASDEMVILATEPDYDTAGVRAYATALHEAVQHRMRFDATHLAAGQQPEPIFGDPYVDSITEIADAWESIYPGRRTFTLNIADEVASAKRSRPGGSWHSYNVAAELAARFHIIEQAAPTGAFLGTAEAMNRNIYAATSAHAHPRPRVNPRHLWLDDRGVIRFDEHDSSDEIRGTPETLAGAALALGQVAFAFAHRLP